MTSDFITVPLYRAAHGRTGDKGNRSNISVIAWHPDLYAVLVAQLTEEAVSRHFAHRRLDLPVRIPAALQTLLAGDDHDVLINT